MKKRKKLFDAIPERALFESEIDNYARSIIPNFIGVFNRERLPYLSKYKNVAFIVNLDDLEGKGTHWVAIRKNKKYIYYFDSFGNLPPPNEITKMAKNFKLYYNTTNLQSFDLTNCGKLSIEFLLNTI